MHQLKIPVMAAPMFLVSGPELVCSCMQSGIIGSFPTPNARNSSILKEWLAQISAASNQIKESGGAGIWSANIVTHRSNDRLQDDLEMISAFQPPIVVTALGGPEPVVDRVHAYGGQVWADVNSIRFAKKATTKGVDGLVLVCAGAGGHTGTLNAFAFISAVREFFPGVLAVGGSIASGTAIRAIELAGADIANIGTPFIATEESLASPEYQEMLMKSDIEDLVLSDAVTGVKAYWLKQSLINYGLNPSALVSGKKPNFQDDIDQRARWSRIWSAGQGVGQITRIQKVRHLVDRLASEYSCSRSEYQ